MNQIIGTCSECGGPVSIPKAWYGMTPPTPTCERCHAQAVPNHGPVIQMTPRRSWPSPLGYEPAPSIAGMLAELHRKRAAMSPKELGAWLNGDFND